MAASQSHVFQPSWSRLQREVLIDKVKGIIYGQAIGDAIGLATEFLDKASSKKAYGKDGPKGYEDIIQDEHRCRWLKGDWTDDTDQMLLILQSIVDNNGVVTATDFAARMRKWVNEGYSELGDQGGMGIGVTTIITVSRRQFLEDPHTAAREVWEESGQYLAANGAAMRTSILGVLNFNDLDKVKENTKLISLTTHADPRCTASCVAITTAIALMLQGAYNPMNSKELKSLVEKSYERGVACLQDPKQQKEMLEHMQASSWSKLRLDDDKTMGYTFKVIGAGFYALRNSKQYKKTIIELIMEGGDADTNGAVAGALMGCKFGFKNLPEDLLQFAHRKWLDRKVERFLTTIGLMEMPEISDDKVQTGDVGDSSNESTSKPVNDVVKKDTSDDVEKGAPLVSEKRLNSDEKEGVSPNTGNEQSTVHHT